MTKKQTPTPPPVSRRESARIAKKIVRQWMHDFIEDYEKRHPSKQTDIGATPDN